MRAGLFLSRSCFRASTSTLRAIASRHRQFSSPIKGYSFKDRRRGPRTPHPLLLAATLSPAAFIKLSEEDRKDGKSGEEQMLEASREEIEKKIPDDMHGMKRFLKTIWVVFDEYLYEPIATGLRFLHLVVIFVPVIITVPAIWLGKRQRQRDDERSGTIWWYGFLVKSMERAGPAFIKVRLLRMSSASHELTKL
jgi:aarF domain-containing kinase